MNGTTTRRHAALATMVARLAGIAWMALPTAAGAGLAFDEALRVAEAQAPSLTARHSALSGARAALPAAATLPDPRVVVGVENVPITGSERYRLDLSSMTMQRIGLMQEVPNRAKREARTALSQARIEREQAMLAVARLEVRREAGLAWLGLHFAQARATRLADLDHENRLLLDTVDARIAAGAALPTERSLAQQEALALADRRDDARRDVARARSALRRWVGERADDALGDAPPALAVHAERAHADVERHAEIVPFEALSAQARAEIGEADAEQRGDWGWELAYSRRGPNFSDLVSFQLRFDLPWQTARRQQPLIAARRHELQRIEAERETLLRRHREEVESELAELRALDAQHERLAGAGHRLADERVALALASYRAGRGELGAVLAARRDVVETRLRLIDLDARRMALRWRLNTLIAE